MQNHTTESGKDKAFAGEFFAFSAATQVGRGAGKDGQFTQPAQGAGGSIERIGHFEDHVTRGNGYEQPCFGSQPFRFYELVEPFRPELTDVDNHQTRTVTADFLQSLVQIEEFRDLVVGGPEKAMDLGSDETIAPCKNDYFGCLHSRVLPGRA